MSNVLDELSVLLTTFLQFGIQEEAPKIQSPSSRSSAKIDIQDTLHLMRANKALEKQIEGFKVIFLVGLLLVFASRNSQGWQSHRSENWSFQRETSRLISRTMFDTIMDIYFMQHRQKCNNRYNVTGLNKR